LANLLNQYESIGVSLEAYFPDGILRRPVAINKNEDVDKFLKILYSDVKFISWGISKSKLRSILIDKDKPIKFSKFLKIILKIYFQEQNFRNINIYIYKCAGYIKYLNILRNSFPESKVIFILRDPRGIYNSQKKSLSSTEKKTMSINPIYTALKWNEAVKIVDRYKNENWFYLIKYEDLIENKELALNNIIDFFGVSRGRIRSNNYVRRIPKEQIHLHENVSKKPIKERVNAWEKELTKIEISLIDRIINKKLLKFGYNFYADENYRKFNIQYIKYKMNYIIQRIFDKSISLKSWNRFLDRVWVRLRRSSWS